MSTVLKDITELRSQSTLDLEGCENFAANHEAGKKLLEAGYGYYITPLSRKDKEHSYYTAHLNEEYDYAYFLRNGSELGCFMGYYGCYVKNGEDDVKGIWYIRCTPGEGLRTTESLASRAQFPKNSFAVIEKKLDELHPGTKPKSTRTRLISTFKPKPVETKIESKEKNPKPVLFTDRYKPEEPIFSIMLKHEESMISIPLSGENPDCNVAYSRFEKAAKDGVPLSKDLLLSFRQKMKEEMEKEIAKTQKRLENIEAYLTEKFPSSTSTVSSTPTSSPSKTS